MTQVRNARNIGNDDLTCPITLELFRDPVIAGDGHVYEREAITKWILEHGTSPLTREPLQINQLQPDNHLRRLAAQRRNSTVFYNARDNAVTLPPRLRLSRVIVPTTPPLRSKTVPRSKRCTLLVCFGCASAIVILSLSLGLGLGSSSRSNPYNPRTTTKSTRSTRSTRSPATPCILQSSQLISIYSNSLTHNSSVFGRPYGSNSQYRYQAIQVAVLVNGSYTFKSNSTFDMYGYLYRLYFNSTGPYNNLLTYNDDAGDNSQFCFRISLQSNNYTLVATTYSSGVIGSFSIIVGGPVNVTFQQQ